ncbi:MAG: AEC family transporter [Pontibacterium sp.]
MVSIFASTAPIFVIIGFGFLIVKAGLLPRDAVPVLGRFVLFVAMPCMVFGTLVKMDLREIFNPHYFGVYALGSLAAFVLIYLLARFVLGRNKTLTPLLALGSSASNSVFFGYPVLLQLFDPAPTEAFTMALMVENLVMFPLAFILLELSQREESDKPVNFLQMIGGVAKRVSGNPVLFAIIAGVFASLIDLQLPDMIDRSLSMVGAATAPVALIVIGGSLVGAGVHSSYTDISLVSAAKLLIHPLMVFIAALLIPGLSAELILAAMVFAAMPMISILPIIATAYRYNQACASIVLVATLAAFVSIPVILAAVSGQLGLA